jgi:hypothetical protein
MASCGVHCYGGAINKASVIGPIGNMFQQLSQALILKKTAPATSSGPQGATTTVPGFVFITVPGSSGSVFTGTEAGVPNGIPADTPNGTPKSFEVELTRFPESLILTESDPKPGDVPSSAITPTDQDYIPTVFFVNMPPGGLPADDKQALGDIQQNVEDFQCWASHLANITVQDQIDKGALGGNDKVAQGTYRAKVMEWILNNKTTWLSKTSDQNTSENLSVKRAEFHLEILQQALTGLTVPQTAFTALEKILNSIGDGIIKGGSTTSKSQQQFWIMLTYYKYYHETGRFQTMIRTIGFQSTNSTREYLVGKSSIQIINFTCQFSGVQFDFNNKIYNKIKGDISADAIENGKKMINDTNSLKIPI